jgi:hypothetical protein
MALRHVGEIDDAGGGMPTGSRACEALKYYCGKIEYVRHCSTIADR